LELGCASTVVWDRQSDLDPHDLDQVGVTLEKRETEEGYFVGGLLRKMESRP
jgi:hypothetical protein